MSIGKPLLAVVLLSALVLCILPSSRADVTLTCSSSPYCTWSYDSGAGVTGTVVVSSDYTLASPASLTATELYFNLTGKTSGLASSQFEFTAAGTGGTGIIPMTIQTDTTYPTYVLNAATYSYSSTTGNMTLTTQNSSQTVTADFSTILSSVGGGGLKLHSATSPITSVSSSSTGQIESLTFVASSSGSFSIYSPRQPANIKKDGNALTYGSDWTYASQVVTWTGASSGTWVINMAATEGSSSGVVGAVMTTTLATTGATQEQTGSGPATATTSTIRGGILPLSLTDAISQMTPAGRLLLIVAVTSIVLVVASIIRKRRRGY